MTNKKSQLSADEKIRITLRTFNPQISTAEICREHNLVPPTVHVWKEKFLDGRHISFEGSNTSKQTKAHKKEIASLKRTIVEYAVANDI